MQPTVAVFGILRFPPDRMPEVRPHLRKLVEATYRHDGCIVYDVAEDLFDPGLIRFSALWPDRAVWHGSLKRRTSRRGAPSPATAVCSIESLPPMTLPARGLFSRVGGATRRRATAAWH